VHRRFAQVDVFGSTPGSGNPVGVVLDGDGIDSERMQQIAAWLNVAETTFVLPPQLPGADYRVRIFTIAAELPFAGHPTLGACHAWLAAGNAPRGADEVVQECASGLIRVRRTVCGLAFAAPPLGRSGPVPGELRAAVVAAFSLDESEIRAMAWVDTGPGWLGVLIDDPDRLLALRCAPIDQFIGVAAIRAGGELEVRAFYPVRGAMVEDPVCGSLNAGLARWLPTIDALQLPYVARQGAALGRDGRLSISREGDEIWVAGATTTLIEGTLRLDRAEGVGPPVKDGVTRQLRASR
jgi:PhzF family phenazine biosynthesis protein